MPANATYGELTDPRGLAIEIIAGAVLDSRYEPMKDDPYRVARAIAEQLEGSGYTIVFDEEE